MPSFTWGLSIQSSQVDVKQLEQESSLGTLIKTLKQNTWSVSPHCLQRFWKLGAEFPASQQSQGFKCISLNEEQVWSVV